MILCMFKEESQISATYSNITALKANCYLGTGMVVNLNISNDDAIGCIIFWNKKKLLKS